MDAQKKISQLSKSVNHVNTMGIRQDIKELLIKELHKKKNAKNKHLTRKTIQKKKSQ